MKKTHINSLVKFCFSIFVTSHIMGKIVVFLTVKENYNFTHQLNMIWNIQV